MVIYDSSRQFFDAIDDIKKESPIERDLWKEVREQSISHTQYGHESNLYSASRPHEEPVYTDWRKANRRNLSRGIVDRFCASITKTLESSSRDIPFTDVLKEHFLLKPFQHLNGKRFDFDSYRYRVIIPYSMEDPNGIIVELPFLKTFPNNPGQIQEISPANNGRSNEKISSRTMLIPSSMIYHSSQNVLCWKGGTVYDAASKGTADFFWTLDREMYEVIYPMFTDEGIKYQMIPWYAHKSGEMLYTEVIGRYCNHKYEGKDGETNLVYKRTYLDDTYNYLDEMIVGFGSDQVNRIRHLNAKFWISSDVKCTECNGRGYVPAYYKNSGNPIKSQGEHLRHECEKCHGSGEAKDFGDFTTLVLSQSSLDKGLPAGEKLGFATPPTENLKFGFDHWQELRKMGEQAACLNLLEDASNTSGVAKEIQLEPKRELVQQIGDDFYEMTESIINNTQRLLERDSKTFITIPKPQEYQYRSPALLKQQTQEAMPAERRELYMRYVRTQYRDDPITIKAHEFATLYAPLLLYQSNELSEAMNSTAYNEADIVRRDWAVYVMKQVLKKSKSKDLDIDKAIELADKYLVERGKLKEEKDPGGDDQYFAGVRKPLDAIGGVSGIGQLNGMVASGTMTREAAIATLVELTNISEEMAEKFIEVPEPQEPTESGPRAVDPETGEPMPEEVDENAPDAETDDILQLLVQGDIGRDVAVTQIAQIEGMTEEEVDQILTEAGL